VVHDVFEVMVQVDRRLTKVNSFDPIVRVNEPGGKPGASQRLRTGASENRWMVAPGCDE
jgi:hypothetical protein